MNRIEKLQQQNRLYKKQIRELQKALEVWKNVGELFHYKYAYYKEAWACLQFQAALPQPTKEEIHERLKYHWTKFNYSIVKNKVRKTESTREPSPSTEGSTKS